MKFFQKKNKTDLVIINRSFWPKSEIIGEGLLQFSEAVANSDSVAVITQTNLNLAQALSTSNRGHELKVKACKSFTDSNSHLIKRISEAQLFTLWTLISLIQLRPRYIYVSTNPPITIPFIVALYSRIFKSDYIYHLQDIHPEAANIVVPLNKLIYSTLQAIDNYTLKNAKHLITISDDMKEYILQRSNTNSTISIVDNPALDIKIQSHIESKTGDIIYCGNLGRLQQIPLLISSIEEYISKGGKLNFTFAGAGVYSSEIQKLADKYQQITYMGTIPAAEAVQIISKHSYALLPINDEVTKYAFPSKSSSYVLADVNIIGICSKHTSVARWIKKLGVGLVSQPYKDDIVSCLFSLETNPPNRLSSLEDTKDKLRVPYFSKKLKEIYELTKLNKSY